MKFVRQNNNVEVVHVQSQAPVLDIIAIKESIDIGG
jgi:hypothetical protein